VRRIRTRGAHRWHPARARPRNTEPRVGVVRRRAAARRAPAALPRQCPHTLAASARIGCPRGALWALATRSPPRPAPRASARTSRSPAQRRRAAGTRGAARAAVYLPVPCAPRHAAMPRGRASLGKALHARQRRLLSTGTLEVGRSWMFYYHSRDRPPCKTRAAHDALRGAQPPARRLHPLAFVPWLCSGRSCVLSVCPVPFRLSARRCARMGVQAATARRAAKRQRSIDEQKKIDSEQEASRKAAEAAGGGEDEWASNFKLLLQYKGEQGRKWWAARPWSSPARAQQPADEDACASTPRSIVIGASSWRTVRAPVSQAAGASEMGVCMRATGWASCRRSSRSMARASGNGRNASASCR